MSLGLTDERMKARSFLESLIMFLKTERCDWIIKLKWASFDGSCEALAGQAFVHRNKAYFDISYPKDNYRAFFK